MAAADDGAATNNVRTSRTMAVGIAVADTCRLTAELWEVLGFPECVHLGKGRAARTQQGRVSVVRDEAGHCVLE